DGRGIVERQLRLGRVEIVLRLLTHGEGTRNGDLHGAAGVALEEAEIPDLHRAQTADLADDARHGVRVSRPVESRAGIVEVDSRERRGEAVGVAFPSDLAVCHDIEPGILLRFDGQYRRIVLRLSQEGLRDPPELAHTDSRRETPGQLLAVDQPLRLRIASYERRREEHGAPLLRDLLHYGAISRVTASRPPISGNAMAYEYRKLYIDGRWVDPVDPKGFTVINPATEAPAGVISMGSAKDVDRAVAAARRAFESFAQTSREERRALLEKMLEV